MNRRRYTPEFKAQIAREAIEVGNVSLVARKHELGKSMVARWVNEYRGRSKNPLSIATIRAQRLAEGPKDYAAENDKLKKIIGEKELELELLRDMLKKTDQASRKK